MYNANIAILFAQNLLLFFTQSLLNHGSYLPPKKDAEVLLREGIPSTLNYAEHHVQLVATHYRRLLFSHITEVLFYRWCEAFKSLRSIMNKMCPEATVWTFDDTTQAFHVFHGETCLYQAKRTLRVRDPKERPSHSSPFAFIWDMGEPTIQYYDIIPPRAQILPGDMRPRSFYWDGIEHMLPHDY